jgi:hypothetical protein
MISRLYKFLEDNKNDNIIPLNDIDSYLRYPNENIVYNKYYLSKIQNLTSAPIPIYPSKYPVIVKPIYNLYGMSKGFKIIKNEKEFKENLDLLGYFWQKYLDGNQINVDMIVKNGEILDYFVLESKPSINGSFDYHKYIKNYKLSNKIINVIKKLLYNYKGVCNVEIINNKIIEMHLRLNGDYFIYNDDFERELLNFLLTGELKKNYIINDYTFFPVFSKNKLNNKKEMIKILEQNKVIHYEFDDYDGDYQRNDLRRVLFFVSQDFNFGENIKKKILNSML